MVSWVPFDAIVLGITISFFILHIEFWCVDMSATVVPQNYEKTIQNSLASLFSFQFGHGGMIHSEKKRFCHSSSSSKVLLHGRASVQFRFSHIDEFVVVKGALVRAIFVQYPWRLCSPLSWVLSYQICASFLQD
jgi:hypothetical protein